MRNITDSSAFTDVVVENGSSVSSASDIQTAPIMRTQNLPELFGDFSTLPREVRHEIYGWASRPAQPGLGLAALAKTSKSQRTDVLDFNHADERGIAFRHMLLSVQTSSWHENAKAMLDQAEKLRMAFGISAKRISNNVEEGVSGQAAIDTLTIYIAVQFCLRSVIINPEISRQIRSVDGKPIKIDASGIGRERYHSELVPALELINPDCSLILDLSNNELQAEDLLPLTAFIKKSPVIYQLDLRDNFLCKGEAPSLPLVALFELVSPLSHLYLSNTAFNSASAAYISPMLHKNPCLMHLDLRNNRLTEAGALALIKAVGYQHAHDQWHMNTVLTAVRLQNNKFSMSDRIGRGIVELQKALDAVHSKKNGDAYPELSPYVLQVDGINVGQMALHELVNFYKDAFSKSAGAERL